jgi:hypothetical protein
MLLDVNHVILIRNYGIISILTKILWIDFINILNDNIKVGFQKVLSI